MTNEQITGSPAVQPTPRARTMALQNAGNRFVRGLLRTPLVSRLAGSRLVTLYIVGRKSGRRYSIPVAYTPSGGDLMIGTSFGWGRNLRTGEPVELRLKGRRRLADVVVMTDERSVTDAYRAMCTDNHTFAKFNRVGLGPDGRPDPGDLRLAWETGARAFRLTPR